MLSFEMIIIKVLRDKSKHSCVY